ncbi:MAG TPA: N-6 DNA methylase, partial [Thermoanaerobaculia bacterium]|nr:N-6 DNA methylase [Thermoanaerobaculia bacterium]
MIVDARRNLIEDVEARRQRVAAGLDPRQRIELGQFFTPSPVADFLASLFELRDEPASLLDPGAGVGSLTAAFVARWARECTAPLETTSCELDSSLHPHLGATLAQCELAGPVRSRALHSNFIEWATEGLGGLRFDDPPTFSHVVMNPPYRKLAHGSRDRDLLRWVGLDAPNLYAAFLALGARLLEPGGQMVAITPRSFANGP